MFLGLHCKKIDKIKKKKISDLKYAVKNFLKWVKIKSFLSIFQLQKKFCVADSMAE